MTGEVQVHIEETALRAIIRSPVAQAAVRLEAERLAGNVRRQGIQVGDLEAGTSAEIDLPVLVEEHSGEDGSLGVYLAHPAGVAVEAAHGALGKAAAQLGLHPGPRPAGGA